MQDATGAKILIRGRGASKDGAPSTGNHPDDNDDLHVHIEGSEEAVEKALKEVRSILFNPEQAMRLKNEQLQRLAEINNGGGSDSHYGPGGSEYQIEMRVPNNMVGLIIGRGGENIARIQSTLQVNVQIAKENEMKPGETLRSIVIRGTKENVDEAKLRIEDIIERDLKKNSMQGGGGGGRSDERREPTTRFVDSTSRQSQQSLRPQPPTDDGGRTTLPPPPRRCGGAAREETIFFTPRYCTGTSSSTGTTYC